MESVFEIIAEPNRRAILSLLVSSQQSVGEIERQLRMPQPTVSKHLRVLREAGFVESTVDAQRRLYRLKPEPFQEVDAWLAQFRRFWSAHLDALERHLDRMDQRPYRSLTPTKRKPKQKTTRPKPRERDNNWGDHDMRWELKAFGGGTRLRLWTNIGHRFIAMGAAGWHICFDVLDHLLSGTPIGRMVGFAAMKLGGWQRLNAEYARQFGIETPTRLMRLKNRESRRSQHHAPTT
jgi:DNA-binding transcriptional ArsR family regulator